MMQVVPTPEMWYRARALGVFLPRCRLSLRAVSDTEIVLLDLKGGVPGWSAQQKHRAGGSCGANARASRQVQRRPAQHR